MEQPEQLILLLKFVVVLALLTLFQPSMRAWIKDMCDLINNFWGGPPPPMRPSPTDDAALLLKRRSSKQAF
jgi:hypothetical protein